MSCGIVFPIFHDPLSIPIAQDFEIQDRHYHSLWGSNRNNICLKAGNQENSRQKKYDKKNNAAGNSYGFELPAALSRKVGGMSRQGRLRRLPRRQGELHRESITGAGCWETIDILDLLQATHYSMRYADK
jgi:hypothetical protein